ncbi:MAG: sigma-54 dependent transcriptional regulator [Gemmatimonadota bacterium]|jgi:two-component system nitrogen regulation response regulator NtrX|nr:sigma-54 dependent transcriptional regulator [Gemmatimonadota bacterium]
MRSILIVDDEANIRKMLGSFLRAEGFGVFEAASADAGLVALGELQPDIVLIDLSMPGRTGLEVLPQLIALAPDVPVVMMSGRASLADAVQATRLGAYHFLEKPLSPETVLLTLRSAIELRRTREVNRALVEELGHGDELIGTSEPMRRVRDLITRVAGTDARVLITGESGTGKELAAAAIHRQSPRARHPFVRVNCAAIPRELIESELFGHEKGAFTGATERRRGRFELADGGTLLLDEIGELSLEAQAKLLRAIESQEIELVGGSRPIRVDIRILAATNRELRDEIRAGRFREDLFFRLDVVPLEMPPLRARSGDIPLLVKNFLRKGRERDGLHPPELTDEAMTALLAYPWPGNVRELANIIERLMILHAGERIGAAEAQRLLDAAGGFTRASGSAAEVPGTPAHGSAHGAGKGERWGKDGSGMMDGPGDGEAVNSGRPFSLVDQLDAFERQLILEALDAARGNLADTARRLSTDRGNLYRRMRRLGIDR